MIRFLLNQRLISDPDLDVRTTVLDYLRRRQGRKGTKEGCASGDCGACTVVLVQEAHGKLRYDSINACITPVSALHGKQLITVEDLRHQGQLHGVQQAMVDHHASQCGFCTPGIVMSLFALQKSNASANDEHIRQSLGGNLCRCTGYRPIIDAARQRCRTAEDQFTALESQTLARLADLRESDEKDAGSASDSPHCLRPHTVTQLAEAYLRHPGAKLLAGGTDLILTMAQSGYPPPMFIDLSQVSELKTLSVEDKDIIIGAGASLSDCEAFLAPHLAELSALLARFASRQIRNQATFGGNLANASPVGDGAPMLLALNASLRLRRGGESRTLPLDQFYLSYRHTALQAGELITHIVAPKVTSSQICCFYKVAKRREDDISAVFGAFCLDIDQGIIDQGIIHSARLAYGGMAAIPKRAAGAEAALLGKTWDQQACEAACLALATDFSPISDLRAGSAYRVRVAQNLLRRFYLSTTLPRHCLEVDHYV